MIGKLALILLVAVAASGNPAANVPWRWIPRALTVSPNPNALPFEDVIKSVVPQKPKYPSGTVKVDGCGQAPLAPKVDPSIVGGTEAVPHSYPWQVALFIDDLYFCGGSLISDEWVLTAAHCTNGASFVEVVLGAHNIRESEASQVSLTSTNFFVHEDYGPIFIRNDISLIRLPIAVTFNDYIQPVCLPSGSDLGAGVTVTATGWGLPSDSASGTSDVLRNVDVSTIANLVCAATYGTSITDDVICIDASDGKGTCNGDSGGPLNYNTGSATETRGITSFGSSEGCESGNPDAFTRVNHYVGWIQDNSGVTI